MSSAERLPTGVEVTGLVRNVQASGDHAAVLHRGDPDRGSVILLIASRGKALACYERILDLNGAYRWRSTGPDDIADSQKVAEFLAKRARFDPDHWAVELDIADPERFIAENLSSG